MSSANDSSSSPSASTSPGFAELLRSFQQRLEASALEFLAERRAETRTYAPEAERLAACLEALVEAGGKRLRPALVFFGYRACGGKGDEAPMPLALSTELLHAYLLVHDDIMDHAELRRGQPAAHARFRRRHQEEGWGGDAEDYGRSMAILVGDLAYAFAVELFAAVEAPAEIRRRLHGTFFRMVREVIDGQYLEMHMGLAGDPGESDLERVLRLKSGLYSVERPVQLGAQLAGASDAQLEALSSYGRAVGEAFQLRDDLLGMFGDPEAIGKPVGDDLREGKFTFLTHHALRLAAEPDAARIRGALGREDLSDSEVAGVCGIFETCGARAAVEEMIRARSTGAREALADLPLEEDGRTFLEGLIGYLEQRRD